MALSACQIIMKYYYLCSFCELACRNFVFPHSKRADTKPLTSRIEELFELESIIPWLKAIKCRLQKCVNIYMIYLISWRELQRTSKGFLTSGMSKDMTSTSWSGDNLLTRSSILEVGMLPARTGGVPLMSFLVSAGSFAATSISWIPLFWASWTQSLKVLKSRKFFESHKV